MILAELWALKKLTETQKWSVRDWVLMAWKRLANTRLSLTDGVKELFSSVVKLSEVVIAETTAPEAWVMLKSLKECCVMTTYNSFLCFLMTDLLECVPREKVAADFETIAEMWIMLFAASASDALLEMKVCLGVSKWPECQGFISKEWRNKVLNLTTDLPPDIDLRTVIKVSDLTIEKNSNSAKSDLLLITKVAVEQAKKLLLTIEPDKDDLIEGFIRNLEDFRTTFLE